jgi:type II secretory pathway component PulF
MLELEFSLDFEALKFAVSPHFRLPLPRILWTWDLFHWTIPQRPQVPMKIDNASLRQFAGSLATCVSSGLPVKKALDLSAAGIPSRSLQQVVQTALPGCDQGLPLSEALAPGAAKFPFHFLPVLRAGEASGRLVETLQLLERHCTRLGPTLRVVRNTWLHPLVCVLFGWIIRAGIFIWFGKYHTALHFLAATCGSAALLTFAGWLAFQLAPVKQMIDGILLQLPLIRDVELRLAEVWFFTTFRLAYEAGNLGVLTVFDLALATVRNVLIRRDLLQARPILEEHGGFGLAFEQPALLDDELKGLIHTGAVSGKLDQTLGRIVEQATGQLELKLQLFIQIFQRIVVLAVAMSIVETILICLQ